MPLVSIIIGTVLCVYQQKCRQTFCLETFVLRVFGESVKENVIKGSGEHYFFLKRLFYNNNALESKIIWVPLTY